MRLSCNLVIIFIANILYGASPIRLRLRLLHSCSFSPLEFSFRHFCCIVGSCVVYECILTASPVLTLLSYHAVCIVSCVHLEIVREGEGGMGEPREV